MLLYIGETRHGLSSEDVSDRGEGLSKAPYGRKPFILRRSATSEKRQLQRYDLVRNLVQSDLISDKGNLDHRQYCIKPTSITSAHVLLPAPNGWARSSASSAGTCAPSGYAPAPSHGLPPTRTSANNPNATNTNRTTAAARPILDPPTQMPVSPFASLLSGWNR